MTDKKYKLGDSITYVNFKGEMKNIDEMSFKQRVKYKINKLAHKAAYKWKRHLVSNNRKDNSALGLTLVGFGGLALINNERIGAIIFATLMIAYGASLIRARRKGGVLDTLIKKHMSESDKMI